jgi:hypothetical protein
VRVVGGGGKSSLQPAEEKFPLRKVIAAVKYPALLTTIRHMLKKIVLLTA